MSDPRVVIVGGGIAGIAAAGALEGSGASRLLLDRGQRLGGRMAVRTLRGTGTPWDGRPVDIGAAFMTARHPDFVAQLADWESRGLARPWTDTLAVAGDSGLEGQTSGTERWAAPGGLRSLAEDLAARLIGTEVRHPHQVGRVGWASGPTVDGEPCDLALLCGPDPQMAGLLGDEPELDPVRATLGTVVWEPVLALTAVYDRRRWPPIAGAFVNDSPTLSFIADDGSRRGDDAPVLVAHSAPALAAAHLGDPPAAAPAMLAALHRVLGVDADPLHVHVQRWSLARPVHGREAPNHLDAVAGVGLAGDGWHGGPRVEAAWLSGRSLGAAAAALLDAR